MGQDFAVNQSPLHGRPLDPLDLAALDSDAEREVEALLRYCPIHQPTPLIDLPDLARRTGIARLSVKDEGSRLRLKSFKALGGAHAVIEAVFDAVERETGERPSPGRLFDHDVRRIAAEVTVACATDGNHGRSVAAGARLVGAKAVIFVPRGVSDNRVEAIAGFGAVIERIEGCYDVAVRAANVASEIYGWDLISDTAWDGNERVPLQVMQGYTVCAAEILREIGSLPTHVFLQAGVGGFAAAIAGHFAACLSDEHPRIIIVEPERAACVLASHRAGKAIHIEEGEPTVMAMLECYQASSVALRILDRTADLFMTVREEEAVAALRTFARPGAGDPQIVSGESGAAGLAGFLKASADPELKSAIGLGPDSRVLVISTEGATDPDLFAALAR